MFQVASQEKPHMGIIHVMSTLLVPHHEGRNGFWIWFWYVGTHLGRKTSIRTVSVQMSFSSSRSHFKSPNVIPIRKDNVPEIVASLVMCIFYINTWETESYVRFYVRFDARFCLDSVLHFWRRRVLCSSYFIFNEADSVVLKALIWFGVRFRQVVEGPCLLHEFICVI